MKDFFVSISIVIGLILGTWAIVGFFAGLGESRQRFIGECDKRSARIFYYNPMYKLGCYLGKSPSD